MDDLERPEFTALEPERDYHEGVVLDVRWFPRALTDDEIREIYDGKR